MVTDYLKFLLLKFILMTSLFIYQKWSFGTPKAKFVVFIRSNQRRQRVLNYSLVSTTLHHRHAPFVCDAHALPLHYAFDDTTRCPFVALPELMASTKPRLKTVGLAADARRSHVQGTVFSFEMQILFDPHGLPNVRPASLIGSARDLAPLN